LCITCSNTVHFGINALRAGRLYFNKHEVYPDVVEKYGGKTRYDTGQPLDYQNEEEGKFRYLRRIIKQVRKTDEIREGIHGSRKRLQELRELLSTPEGQKEQEIAINVVLAENEFIEFYLNNRATVEIDKIITELKKNVGFNKNIDQTMLILVKF
jgi:hypothetical protein